MLDMETCYQFLQKSDLWLYYSKVFVDNLCSF